MPDFEALVRFLITPFLEFPDSLRLDSEQLADGRRLWVRIAFSPEDKGRVFGRGGRNIQAIRTVLKAAGSQYDRSVHLDVYGESSAEESSRGGRSRNDSRGGRPHRRGGSRPGPVKAPPKLKKDDT